jgi:hypothetical protein
MPIKPLDTLIAYKVLAIIPGLTASERRVAGAIIDHFNRVDDRCDPGIERLARLLRLDRRTVFRAVETLDRLGLILKDRHGGRSLRNSYEPVWDKFREIEANWKGRFNDKSVTSPVTNSSRGKWHGSPERDGEPVTQTFLVNQSTTEPVSNCASSATRRPLRGGKADGSARKEKEAPPHSRAAHPIHRTALRGAADIAAERRWNAQLLGTLDKHDYVKVSMAIDEVIRAGATTAELRNPGAGLPYLLEAVRNKIGQAVLNVDRQDAGDARESST